jgi:hypothetical protein
MNTTHKSIQKHTLSRKIKGSTQQIQKITIHQMKPMKGTHDKVIMMILILPHF